MNEEIYSKVRPDKQLLHFVVRNGSVAEGRTDLVNADQFIQCSALRLKKDTTFKPHKHNWKQPTNDYTIAQESWVVIRGSVRCFFYDLDGTLLKEVDLFPGDASFTLAGGHNYLILEDDTFVFEYKTGPYLGQELDKTFL